MIKSLLYSSSIFYVWVAFFISINFEISLSSDDSRYVNCSSSFSCGEIKNVKYPFWGGERAEYCGRSTDFELKCENDVPKITINYATYRILYLNASKAYLQIARDDLWDTRTGCPVDYSNSSIGSFRLTDGVVDMMLYYDCKDLDFPINQFFSQDCNRSGETTKVYYVMQTQSWMISQLAICKSVIVIPVLKPYYADAATINRAILQEALKSGFGLQYSVNEQCLTCEKSAGACGFNQNFTCFCKDRPYPISCPTPSSGKRSNKSKFVIAGIGTAAGLVGIFLGCWLYFVLQRRKRMAAQSESKDLFMPPPSRGGATSTTNTSHSVPSYHSSSVQRSSYFGVQVFTYNELEEATNDFDPSKELGDGGFGTVYYGKLRDGRAVAVKRLYESTLKRVEQFMNEVEILARLRHENLVALYGCTSRHSRELLLVYEYIPNGTVADHIHGNRAISSLLPWPIRLKIAVETAQALAYLHSSDVIHRDVKTNNILLDKKFCVKVADFGLSRLFPNDVSHVSTAPQGTPGYVDPEYYQCYQLTDKSDVYSFGVVLAELISSLEAVDVNRHRHDVNLANLAISKIQNHALKELVDPYLGFERDQNVRQMITSVAELAFRCLQRERDTRPSMEEVVNILREIQNQDFGVQEAEVVDIREDDITLLKNVSDPPHSPNSVTDKWISGSTASNSS